MRSSRGPELLLVFDDPEPLPDPPVPGFLFEPCEVTVVPSGMDSSRRMCWCAPWPTVTALYVVTCNPSMTHVFVFCIARFQLDSQVRTG